MFSELWKLYDCVASVRRAWCVKTMHNNTAQQGIDCGTWFCGGCVPPLLTRPVLAVVLRGEVRAVSLYRYFAGSFFFFFNGVWCGHSGILAIDGNSVQQYPSIDRG